MKMQDLIERFPDVEVIKLTDLIPAKEVGKGPWKIYVFMPDGYHRGGKWFRDGRIKYPDEEISFHEAKQRAGWRR